MASGSAKNQEDTREAKEPAEEQESNAADSAAAAATDPPPLAPPSQSFQEGAHGSPEAGGQDPSTATAAVAERKGEETMAPAPAGGKPSLPPRPTSISRARGASSASGKAPLPPRPTTREEVVASGMADKARGKTSEEVHPTSEAEQMPTKRKGQVKSWLHTVQKKTIWRKCLNRMGNYNGNHAIMIPHVNYEKVHMAGIIRHYNFLEMVAEQGLECHSNVLNLHRAYSEFRPVHRDGECFYRSFIFSYLEQVLDRQDTHEEHRLLAAVKVLARQHARLGWDFDFSRSHKAFKKLIKKVMRWKTHGGWKHVPTMNSYRSEKLLEFFSSYDKTDDIFTFLRLVAAIWICSHSEEFEPLLPGLNESYTLTDWCFQEVIQHNVFTDHIQITALARALGVPLRVEYLFQEVGQDIYTGQNSEDDIPICTCLPRHHHVLPPDHQAPRVTLLYSDAHYDVIYPTDDQALSTDQSSQQSDKVECQTSAKSPSLYQRASCSDQQIDWVVQNSSSEESDHQLSLSGELFWGSDKVECSTTGRSSSEYQGDSCSDGKSSRQIDWTVQSSIGEELNRQLPLPDELLWDIFLKLPVVDIYHSMSVCKQFRNVIKEEYFQHQHSQTWSPRVLIYHKPDTNPNDEVPVDEVPHIIETFNVTTRDVSPLLYLTSLQYSFNHPMGIWVQGSCDGMILLSYKEKLCIWSPWTGWWRHLTPIHQENVIIAFYAHSQCPQTNAKEYRILCRSSVQEMQGSYWILKLGKSGFNAAKEIGRPLIPGSPLQLDSDLRHLPSCYHGPPTVINGLLVWLLPPHFQVNYLVTFNIMLEVFGVIDIPETNGLLPYQLLQVQNRIAIAFLNQEMDSIDVWVLLNPEDGWVSIHNIDLPMSEIQAMRGMVRFKEPIIYIVPESLDILIWTPEFLIVVDPNGLVLEYHCHDKGWFMLAPHTLKVRFEEPFSGPEDVVPPFPEEMMPLPPFFRFPEVMSPAGFGFTQTSTESGIDGTSSTDERSNQHTSIADLCSEK